MGLTLDDLDEVLGADVVDAKGEFIGTVREPHLLHGELVGLIVELDEDLARLPTVDRDAIEIALRFLARDGDALRVGMDLMEAVTGHAPASR